MEPAARTVASGPDCPMRAGCQRARTDSLWAPTGRQWPRRHQMGPYRGVGEGPGLRAAEGTARGSWAGLWAHPMVYVPGGWGTASACPAPHAIRRPG